MAGVCEKHIKDIQSKSFLAVNYNAQVMLLNTFKIMWRNAQKYKLSAFIQRTLNGGKSFWCGKSTELTTLFYLSDKAILRSSLRKFVILKV